MAVVLNAAGAMSVVPHAWQHIPALLLLTIIVMTVRAHQGRSLVDGAAAGLHPPAPTATPLSFANVGDSEGRA